MSPSFRADAGSRAAAAERAECALGHSDEGRAGAAPAVGIRPATEADAPVLHRLIMANLEAGHLLPRSLPELTRHASRFFVAHSGGQIIGCAELAPLSGRVAEIRSLVVDEAWRRNGVGRDLILTLRGRARAEGFVTLCAFTHDPRPFVRLGFSLVPHVWVPEKLATDCSVCPLFRRCGQVAVIVRP
jgi:amino-acid N-acetyltransferase